NEKLGPLALGDSHKQPFLGRDLFDERNYSEETAKNIDQEVRNVVEEAYQRAHKILTENRDKMEILAKRLIEKEVMDIAEARILLNMPEPTIVSQEEPVEISPQPQGDCATKNQAPTENPFSK
ncbi:MAG: cell division protein FtsH, partial [Candidatus Omnitrophica bacterium]|nr:cell division protein FtsH [Candidatus Omnitrophota bacterium]